MAEDNWTKKLPSGGLKGGSGMSIYEKMHRSARQKAQAKAQENRPLPLREGVKELEKIRAKKAEALAEQGSESKPKLLSFEEFSKQMIDSGYTKTASPESIMSMLQAHKAALEKEAAKEPAPASGGTAAAAKKVGAQQKASETSTLAKLQQARAKLDKTRTEWGADSERTRAALKEAVAARKEHEKGQKALQTGARGGQYYVSESGEKVYVGKK